MRTTADEKLDSATEHITGAIKDLVDIVVNECHGHDEFREEYREKIRKSLAGLLEIKHDLNRGQL